MEQQMPCNAALNLQRWHAIVNARGFPNGFPQWVLDNDIADYVPEMPSLQWLQSVLQAVLYEEEQWVSVVKARQYQLNKARMDADWEAGGSMHAAALKQLSAPSLQSLAQATPVQVAPLRTTKGTPASYRVVQGPLPHPGDVWKVGKNKALIKRVEGDFVTLDVPYKEGMRVREVSHLTWNSDPAFLAGEISSFWKQFWHSPKRADLDFVQNQLRFLPSLQPFDDHISVTELQWVLKKLPKKKARGLDGFSNAELKAMPADLRAMLLTLLNTFTQTAVWPQVLTQAVVSLLSKVDVPTEASDARPITILGTIYRVWATCMTMKIIVHLLPSLPSTLYGCIPGRSPMDMAWSLQSSIEETFYSQASLAGASMDLTKAFNLIPRDGFQVIARQLGWPNTLLRAHDAFLRGLNRFFCFGGTLYRPTSSSVGVPEGCPVSVAAMMVITWVADARMRTMTHVSLHSYVDNWSVQHSDANIVLQATANAVETIESLAMSMSFDKLKMYATDVKARKFLRASQISGHSLQVVHDFKDLGVFFCAVQGQTAKGFNVRFEKMQHRFQKLQVVRWSDFRKAKSLSRVILPGVLYGSELVHISTSSFRKLRGRCSSALWGRSNQRDHFLAPLLSAADIYEPFLIVFQKRWQSLQKGIRQDPVNIVRHWNMVLAAGHSMLVGPISYFQEQLARG
ncbi:Pol [Symbiodinium natans]|uniref:Pol protein n=1 Tax=Symbiodinium natans TaxID=878477 RepID=A0A812JB02_9DINO|nr:Pol [Symbiodinium natans]